MRDEGWTDGRKDGWTDRWGDKERWKETGVQRSRLTLNRLPRTDAVSNLPYEVPPQPLLEEHVLGLFSVPQTRKGLSEPV